jgi:RNA polymerase sigma-B factor
MSASSQTHLAMRRSAFEDRSTSTRELFLLAQSCVSEHERRRLIDTVIEMYLDYAHAQAAKYRSRGLPIEDLRQVAALALTRAAHGYDVNTGNDFMSYAGPTIRGELRKYFRDHGWMIRPTRSIQELQARISVAEVDLSYELGTSPRPAQIADRLRVPVGSVIEALASDGCFRPTSLDLATRDEGSPTLADLLPGSDDDRRAAEARMMLHPALRTLSERERLILHLRFYEGLTQREVGDRIGVTQMQVSRLLTRILARLRHSVGDVAS